jgi:hypothetical protein
MALFMTPMIPPAAVHGACTAIGFSRIVFEGKDKTMPHTTSDLFGKRLHPKAAEYRYTGYWWYKGTEEDWRALPAQTREALSLEHTGCLYAFPSWKDYNTCRHTDCCIARKEILPIVKVNSQLRAEAESGWLRFVSDRRKLAAIFRLHRKLARQTGQYDIWSKNSWAVTVYGGLNV